jgi:HPt (histidine-containing phosphotransfer) domain-containing protein
MNFRYFSPTILELISDCDTQITHELLETYLSQIEGVIQELNQAFSVHDYTTLQTIFHKHESCYQMLGLIELNNLFTKGQLATQPQNNKEIATIITSISVIIPIIEQEINYYLATTH